MKYLRNESSDLYEIKTLVFKTLTDHKKKFHEDRCIDARARAEGARTRDKTCVRAFTTSAPIFMKIFFVVNYYLMNLSFKFHKDWSLNKNT